MSDPFRDELEAAHHRIEELEGQHRARLDRLERENRRLQERLVEIAPSRTRTGRVFLALAIIMLAASIGAGMFYARLVRPTPVQQSVQLVESDEIELGESPTRPQPNDFDRDLVTTALEHVDLDECVSNAHRPGYAHARLVILASGFVASAQIDRGDYVKTSEGRCIEERLRAARVPAWTGRARTVGKSFQFR